MQSDELDRLLDAALAGYGSAEPRIGFESRVLARVRMEKPRLVIRWATVAAALAALMMVVLFWPRRVAEFPLPNPTRVRVPAGFEIAVAHAGRPLSIQHPALRRKSVPKLEQFPRRIALTEQEKLLMMLPNSPELAKSLVSGERSTAIEPIQIRELQLEKLNKDE